MKQKIMLVCLALLLCFSVAMGEETIAPPQDDGLVELTEEDLLEKIWRSALPITFWSSARRPTPMTAGGAAILPCWCNWIRIKKR